MFRVIGIPRREHISRRRTCNNGKSAILLGFTEWGKNLRGNLTIIQAMYRKDV